MKIRNLVAAVGIAAMSATSAMAAVIDLGFSLDESGSVSTAEFNLTRDALADALANIPTTGGNTYRLAVTQFGSGSEVIIPVTTVTAGNLPGLQAMLRATTTSRESRTETNLAISDLTNMFINAGGLGDTTILNITTDGDPNISGVVNDQLATENAAAAARALGVDGISFEAVGGVSLTTLGNMARIAGIGTSGVAADGVVVTDLTMIPNAKDTGFVIRVDDFTDYQAAIDAKIQKVIIDIQDVPLPAGLPLLLVGMGAFGLMRRKQQAA